MEIKYFPFHIINTLLLHTLTKPQPNRAAICWGRIRDLLHAIDNIWTEFWLECEIYVWDDIKNKIKDYEKSLLPSFFPFRPFSVSSSVSIFYFLPLVKYLFFNFSMFSHSFLYMKMIYCRFWLKRMVKSWKKFNACGGWDCWG